jgi:predicted nucleotidyltransferase
VIRDSLSPVREKIAFAFIFGSSARHQQAADSDIDLFILGDVSLKELSPYLRTAEDKLGKPINSVLYPEASFIEKYQNGDSFLADVVQREKIPVFPEQITGKEIKDDLRRLASVSVAK